MSLNKITEEREKEKAEVEEENNTIRGDKREPHQGAQQRIHY